MLETGRRSAISTSELGLYFDRSDRYHRSRYSLIVRKLAIGVMVVVTVILVAIFMYDFASATSANSKASQETKHIYILQNALRKSYNLSRRTANFSVPSDVVNRTAAISVEDRLDDAIYDSFALRNATGDLTPAESRIMRPNEAESRSQNLHNFKQRKRVLKSVESAKENEGPESKQLLDNHAIVYRVRQRYKHPDDDDDDDEEDMSTEEARPAPFHWEFKTPHPASFKRPRYPQLSQYRYPQSSRNIQDIIKYLTNDSEMPKRGIKFTGVYMNPKKYDLIPGIGEMMSSSDRSSEEVEPSAYPLTQNNDPFYQYKPKHPADVNLLATSNVRFSPTGLHRYSPYYDSLYNRPLWAYNKPFLTEPTFENIGSYSTNSFKNRKPKPFSVMLDIYPITDIMEQNKKTKPLSSMDDFEFRRPFQFNRGPKFFATSSQPSIPLVALPTPTTLSDEEERQQMILHLNLYPRKKKLNRSAIIHKSESMGPEERQQFAKKIMSPLESIAKHLTDHSAIEESKLEESRAENLKFERNAGPTTNLPLTRYQEINLDDQKDEKDLVLDKDPESYPDPDNEDDNVEDATVPLNHRLNGDEDYASTEKYEDEDPREEGTTTTTTTTTTQSSAEDSCANCDNAMVLGSPSTDPTKDIDTVEGFQRFSDGLLYANRGTKKYESRKAKSSDDF